MSLPAVRRLGAPDTHGTDPGRAPMDPETPPGELPVAPGSSGGDAAIGYTCSEEIYAGSSSTVHRGTRGGDAVIIKRLREAQLSRATIAQYRRELEIAKRLERVRGVVRIHELCEQHGTLALVMEDCGRSLRELVQIRRLELTDTLAIMAQVAEALGHIHAASVVHLDINPANIAVRGPDLEVAIIDFGLAFVMQRGESRRGTSEATLHYLAPEQTGRLDRSIDHRADLYSLGATMYELLTGAPPFVSDDPGELIHAHLARRPVEPHAVDAAIPETVSRIAMKLLAKDPDHRYQSALGVAADLEACRAALRTGTIGEIELGRADLPHRLVLPHALFGREQPLAELLAGFATVAGGERRLQLVGGYAGVGKTCLIEELRRPVAARGGYFAAGKFDQLKNDIPYSGVIMALRHVAMMLLSEAPDVVARWRDDIGSALGADAAVVIELVPELGLLLEAAPATGQGTRDVSRLVPRLLIKLIAKLSTPEHPLVLFLDDLQWADLASLRLVEDLMKAEAVRSLYLIATYRDNEVTAAHPVLLLAQTLALAGARVATLVLEPLQLPSVVQLLGEALGQPAAEVTTLAEVVVDKTRGNPFFVRAFVDTLADAELVRFDATARAWCWDIAAIRGRTVTDNVVDLLIEKIDRLGARARESLIVAACLGSELELASLATATEIAIGDLVADLAPVVEAGLLLIDDRLGKADVYQFAHDRVQQAAYALIPAAERIAVHQRIGRRLLAATPEAARDRRLFELLHHLNFGMDASPRPEPAPGLLEMNLAAGKKARARAAHAAGLRHFELGIALLHERFGSAAQAWKTQHGLALVLHDAATEAAFLCGDLARMEVLARTIRERATSVEQTIKSVRVRIGALHAQLRFEESLDLCMATLATLGVSVPRRPSKLRMARSIIGTLVRLRGHSSASLAALPQMSDPRWRLVMDLIGDATLTAYLESHELFVILSLTMVDLSLRYGNCEISIRGYSSLAIVLCSLVGDAERGNEIVDAIEAIAIATGTTSIVQRYGLASCVRHWKHHLRDGLPMYLRGLRDAVEAGNHKIAAHNAFLYCSASYAVGRDLPELASEIVAYANAIRRMNETNGLRYLARMQQSLINLMSDGDTPWLLIGEAFDERTELSAPETPTNRSHFLAIYIEKMQLAVMFRQPERGLICRGEAARLLDAIPGYFLVSSYYFYGALLQLSVCDGAPEPIRRALMRSAQRSLDKLRKFARGAPMNYLHCARLVEAEQHRIAGRQGEALDAYEQAIELAREHKYRQHEALANELAGRFHLQHGRRPPAKLYLACARALYLRWGAMAKVRRLEDEFPDLAEDRVRPASSAATITGDLGHLLDVGSVIKASQRLSSEVVLSKLVAALMTLVAENAGAERGFLISNQGAGWNVNAAYGVDDANVAAPAYPIPFESCRDLATSMVHYVLRTREPLVLADATRHGPFVGDAYVRQRQPRSILVVPMLRQGEPTGVLYLENNLSTGAFTPERVEILSLLASQAAISIENAHLYEHLERKVAERTATLEQLQQVAVARYAGLAESATGVLHDVNNILNSVVVSCSELTRGFQGSRVGTLNKVVALLQQHGDDVGQFLTSDPKGKEVPRLLGLVAKQLETENTGAIAEVTALRQRVNMISDVVAAQQSAATSGPRFEKVELSKIVDDVLQILALADGQQPIRVVKQYEPIGPVVVHRTKLAHVVVNLVKNAVEAVAQRPGSERQIAIRIGVTPTAQPYLSIRDNGTGVAPEDRDRLFGHGFTTKATGHGFGLHACAAAMTEMNGSITADSAGLGHGATFTLTFAAPARPGA